MTSPTAVLAIFDPSFRECVGRSLRSLRWQVIEATGGADVLAQLEKSPSQAVILDTKLPDLDVTELLLEVRHAYPEIDLISTDGSFQAHASVKNGRRGELLHALRTSRNWDGAAHLTAPEISGDVGAIARLRPQGIGAIAPNSHPTVSLDTQSARAIREITTGALATSLAEGKPSDCKHSLDTRANLTGLPELIGSGSAMLEVARRVLLVASRKTSVLIQGPTGSGKEVIAKAIHRLSKRSNRPFVAINCAAIPENLLEAELFGHTRGAFTGAVQNRIGRIEAAHGGTLFLDEIGEMPPSLQAKLLRFLEAGEIHRIGENDPLTLDVRIVAATHQPLEKKLKSGSFREDVFYRLAVFVIRTPSLSEHMQDIPALAGLFLRRLAEETPAKSIEPSALEKLASHTWPGNVRELAHVIERSYVLSDERLVIKDFDIEFASNFYDCP